MKNSEVKSLKIAIGADHAGFEFKELFKEFILELGYDVKDFGNVFPGHGGVLDRFDSPMLVAPFLCLTNAIVFCFKDLI